MAHFYGSLSGMAHRKTVTRTGSKRSGVKAHVCGWDIGGMAYTENLPEGDCVHLRVTQGSNNPSQESVGMLATNGEISFWYRDEKTQQVKIVRLKRGESGGFSLVRKSR